MPNARTLDELAREGARHSRFNGSDLLEEKPGPPDLAVELVAPGDSYSELHEKALAWLSAGARVVLVADPATRHITVYRSAADVRVLTSDEPVACTNILPGFAPPASALFP